MVRLDPDKDIRDSLLDYLAAPAAPRVGQQLRGAGGGAEAPVDLLVVASRRLGALQLAAAAVKGHGSVSSHALALAPCPVLVVPQPTLEWWVRQIKAAEQAVRARAAQIPAPAGGASNATAFYSATAQGQLHHGSGSAAAGGSSSPTAMSGVHHPSAAPVTPPHAAQHHPGSEARHVATPLHFDTAATPRAGSPPPGALPSKDTTVVGGGLPPRALLFDPSAAAAGSEDVAMGEATAADAHLRVSAEGPLHPGEQRRQQHAVHPAQPFVPPGGWPPGATALGDA